MYRHYAPNYQPLSGDGARLNGGRWNPRNSFGVVYTAFDLPTLDREFERSVAMSRMARPLPRTLATITVRLRRVLDLTDERVRDALGVETVDLVGDDVSTPQAIGEAAHHLGFEGIVAPSATGEGTVLALFVGSRSAESEIEVVETAPYRPSATR